MADVNYAAFSFIAKPAITIAKCQSNHLLPRASHAPSPLKLAKPRRRRNSLRPKILTQPYSPPELNPSLGPIAPLEAPLPELNDESVSVVSVENDRAAEELVLGGASGRSLAVRYGLYFIGAFVFQTILAVWILGNGSSDEKDENLDGLDSDRKASLVNGNIKGLGSNVVQLGERIDEIRSMARQARRDEKSENVGDESLSSRSRIGIEREIGNRLKKLQKRLNSDREKFPGLYTRHLSKLGASSEAKKGNDRLVFRKKLRFRSSQAEVGESPKAKGFGGFEKNKVFRGSVVGDEAVASSEGENGDVRNGWKESKGNGTIRENDGKEAGSVTKLGNGVIQESSLGRPSTELTQSETSKASRRGKDHVPVEENREADDEESYERPVLNGNGSSRHNDAERKPASSKFLDKQPSAGTDMWWLDLPYVQVVLIHQDSDPEGVAGFYTLKPDTEAKDRDESSYTVAFEDRGDANNLCFILESFFEDLGDVRADIIPMSVKELQAAVNSGKWKVIVVRKGQLRLYAGQPFEEVEMALHKLVEEAESD